MIKLIEPNEQYMASYIEAYDEFVNNGISSYGLTNARTNNVLEKFDDYKNERNLKEGRVGAHYYWLVDDERAYFIGEITIRHRLTEALLRHGGHIGYCVRMTEWGKGYGTQMLKLTLPEAKKIGLSDVLITCNDENIGSARVMEKNGFVLGDKVENCFDGVSFITRRYWKTL